MNIPVYIAVSHISMIRGYLTGFKQVSTNLWTFRCPLCGDSTKNKSKKRGYIYMRTQKFYMKCHNCSASMHIENFIKKVSPAVYDSMRLEVFKDSGERYTSEKDFVFDDSEFNGSSNKIVTQSFLHSTHVPLTDDSVPDEIVEYALDRDLPLDKLYYTADIKSVLQKIDKYRERMIDNPSVFDNFIGKPSICIPYITMDGNLTHLQYRFTTNESFRYLTLEVYEHIKMWGLDSIDTSKRVYVFEGAFDAMMIPNSVALAQGDLSNAPEYLNDLGCSDVVLVYDNDYSSNVNINKNIASAIADGSSVVIYDKEFLEKDMNKMFTTHNWDSEKGLEYLKSRTFKGMRAKLELTKYSSLNKPKV